MKISTKVRYGMRAMIELARRNNDAPVMLGIIAKNQEISEKYLEQLFTLLKNGGLVKSERGSKGGYRLARKAEEITVYDVFTAMNGPLELVECINGSGCEREKLCETKDVWRDMTAIIEKFLKERTIAELINSKIEKGDSYVI